MIKDYLLIALSALAIGSVAYLVLSDPFFTGSLIGRALGVLILSAGTFGIWIAGVSHGIKISRESMEQLTSEMLGEDE